MHVSAGMFSFFDKQLTPQLQLTLKGIWKTQAVTQPLRICLPITLRIMGNIKTLLARQPSSYYNIMIWAACCLAFFGFLRVGEFTVPADDQYDESCHLSFSSISIDSRVNSQQLRIIIKQSKTDPFRKGVSIFLGAIGETICPVRGILPYLAIRGNRSGPLFISEVLPVINSAQLLLACSTNSKWMRSATTLIASILGQPPVQGRRISQMRSFRLWVGRRATPTSHILRLHCRSYPSFQNIGFP